MRKKVLIVGRGVAGRSLAKSLKQSGQPVTGFLDDKSKSRLVLGKLADVNVVVAKHKITDIYFAIPTATAQVVRNFINQITDEKVRVSILPRSFATIAKETVNIQELTDVDVLALIGRQPVKHDLLACKALIEGKTVAVTGAAGSIGSRLVKILAGLEPKKIICIDWWENGTFFLQQDLQSEKIIEYRIADVKNPRAIDLIFVETKPDILFHAAAYKHVPLMQHNAVEAFNNNVWGSLNIMRHAIKHKVKNFVLISTDKAVNPANVMGSTKRLAEMLLETLADSQTATKFNAVRFGNVIQSNGSVMQIFKNQIERGLPLTVTHKDITRYFMTVEEAAQLVIQSATLGRHGEIFVLDMGEPVKVIDLAKSLIKLLNRPIKIKITGLRPGEKMFEELSYDEKSVGKTANDKIFIVKNEKPFDRKAFVRSIDKLIEKTLAYELTSPHMVTQLKGMGFPIKD
ncbi:MAG TPA: polysaccharide biosynthesis protein [Candidatus Saccharimonadales bacterium]|nr:polysaccharide biosynthesis protein [Candidatus Saccharimonadales bacterium]